MITSHVTSHSEIKFIVQSFIHHKVRISARLLLKLNSFHFVLFRFILFYFKYLNVIKLKEKEEEKATTG